MKLKRKPTKPQTTRHVQNRVEDARLTCAALIARGTAGRKAGALRVDFKRLDPTGRAELITLTQKAADGASLDLSQLDSREVARWEELACKASGLVLDTLQQERDLAALRRESAKLAAEVARPPQKSRDLLPAGAVVLPAGFGEDLRTGVLWVNHLAVLAALLYQFESGIPWSLTGRFEGSDAAGDLTLVVDRHRGFLGKSLGQDDVRLNAWMVLDDLVQNGWFTLKSHGKERRIQRGPKALALGRH